MSKTIKKLSRRFHVVSENTGKKGIHTFQFIFCYFWRKGRHFYLTRCRKCANFSRSPKKLFISSLQWQNKRILTLAFEKKKASGNWRQKLYGGHRNVSEINSGNRQYVRKAKLIGMPFLSIFLGPRPHASRRAQADIPSGGAPRG